MALACWFQLPSSSHTISEIPAESGEAGVESVARAATSNWSLSLALSSGCRVRQGKRRSRLNESFQALAVHGPDSWPINGVPHAITSTYLLDLPEGLQFTLEMEADNVPVDTGRAIEQAWDVIQYAYETDRYKRLTVEGPGTTIRVPERMGVVLNRRKGPFWERVRAGISISDIRSRITLIRKDGGNW